MKQHFAYIDTLRVIAMVLVICIHVGSMFISSQNLSLHDNGFLTYQFIHIVSSCAVCIFVMISGALLLDRSEEITYHDVLFRFIPRIIAALLIFGIPMCILEQFVSDRSLPVHILLKNSIVNLLTGQCWTHMWYLYMLIGLYLITPLLHIYIINTNRRKHIELTIVLLILGFIVPNFKSYTDITLYHYMTLPSFIASFYWGFIVKRYLVTMRSAFHASWIILVSYVGLCYLQAGLEQPHYGPHFLPTLLVSSALFCVSYRFPVFGNYSGAPALIINLERRGAFASLLFF